MFNKLANHDLPLVNTTIKTSKMKTKYAILIKIINQGDAANFIEFRQSAKNDEKTTKRRKKARVSPKSQNPTKLGTKLKNMIIK